MMNIIKRGGSSLTILQKSHNTYGELVVLRVDVGGTCAVFGLDYRY